MPKSPLHSFFVSCPQDIEDLLEAELQGLGATATKRKPRGVEVTGDLRFAYETCLWSRLANRVYLWLEEFPAGNPEQLYEGIKKIDWQKQFKLENTFAVEASLRQSSYNHRQYARQKAKDAIVDRFRAYTGARPSVNPEQPDIQIHVDVHQDMAKVGIDLAGYSLHQRGYRVAQGAAPLKENLAAAMLMRAGWTLAAQKQASLYDPMCGSGTFLIEGAWIAADIAPGLLRSELGSPGWLGHDRSIWREALARAKQRRKRGILNLKGMQFVGRDKSERSIQNAIKNAHKAGLEKTVSLKTRPIKKVLGESRKGPGLLITNPPYGERMNSTATLDMLYRLLGQHMKEDLQGWNAAVLTSNLDSAKRLGLRAHRRNNFYNGKIQCSLLRYEIFLPESSLTRDGLPTHSTQEPSPFANRLRKNQKKLRPWLKREGISCYRLYDADMPDYNVSVDIYGSAVLVNEYKAPATIDDHRAQRRLNHILDILPNALGVDPEHIHVKTRRRQTRYNQYTKAGSAQEYLTITESGHRFLVNLNDYIDTGLFLDHRNTRRYIQSIASGRRVLNLFGYTASASVYAAKGGAKETLTVDRSNTYLDWAEKNFRLNKLSRRDHQLEKSDCLSFLQKNRRRYDLIFMDPPTFSNSKSAREDFDLQRDHPALLNLAQRALEDKGIIIFSNHSRRFQFRSEDFPDLLIEEITERTIPEDFKRNSRIHRCWEIRKK